MNTEEIRKDRIIPKKKTPYTFAAAWLVASAILIWLIAIGQVSFHENGTWIALLVLIPCTALLLSWIRNPIGEDLEGRKTKKAKLVGSVFIAITIVVLLVATMGKYLVLVLPVAAATVLLLHKGLLTKREWLYATFLALLAGLAGLGNESISFITPVQWGFMQVPMTLFSFLAGWSILRRTGVHQQGVGRSRFIDEGTVPAIHSFLIGILLGTPWALANVVMGSAEGSRATWVQSWWQPLVAFNPGIAEEAWGRFLWIPLAFLFFRRSSPNRTAFSIALILMAYMFAFIHTVGSGNGVEILLSTFITGTLFVLPVSVLCLYRDLETAIGFHFWMDLIKFSFALVWFSG